MESAGRRRQASSGTTSPTLPSAYSESRSTSTHSWLSSSKSSNRLLAWCATARPWIDGRTDTALMHRSSVRPDGTIGRHQTSDPSAGTEYGFVLITRSGGPKSSS